IPQLCFIRRIFLRVQVTIGESFFQWFQLDFDCVAEQLCDIGIEIVSGIKFRVVSDAVSQQHRGHKIQLGGNGLRGVEALKISQAYSGHSICQSEELLNRIVKTKSRSTELPI